MNPCDWAGIPPNRGQMMPIGWKVLSRSTAGMDCRSFRRTKMRVPQSPVPSRGRCLNQEFAICMLYEVLSGPTFGRARDSDPTGWIFPGLDGLESSGRVSAERRMSISPTPSSRGRLDRLCPRQSTMPGQSVFCHQQGRPRKARLMPQG